MLINAILTLKRFGVHIDVEAGRALASESILSIPAVKQALDVARGAGKQAVVEALERLKKPYLLDDGSLVIPSTSPEKYWWWAGGQSVEQTKAELSTAAH